MIWPSLQTNIISIGRIYIDRNMTGILKINMVEEASTTHFIRFKWNSEMVEDLTDALQYNEAVFEYQGPDIRIPHEGFLQMKRK